MANNRYSLKQIADIQNRKVFFDTNVLIYLFWPSVQPKLQKLYSSAFKSLRGQKNELFVDFCVISEMINGSLHIEYENHIRRNNLNKKYFSKKKYRDGPQGQKDLEDIYLIVKDNILKTFTVLGKSFTKTNIEKFLTVESLDFMDKAILVTCSENDCVLCTNDKDFNKADIDILTCNPNIL